MRLRTMKQMRDVALALGFVTATLVASFPATATADSKHRHRHKKQRCRTEYVVRVDPAVYRRPVYYAPPPPPVHACGYYLDRDCDRRFTSYGVYLEHARRHRHSQLVFVVQDDEPRYSRASGWSGWVRVSW